MNEYYTHMKEDIGIDPNYAPEEDDPDLDRVLVSLKTNS